MSVLMSELQKFPVECDCTTVAITYERIPGKRFYGSLPLQEIINYVDNI